MGYNITQISSWQTAKKNALQGSTKAGNRNIFGFRTFSHLVDAVGALVFAGFGTVAGARFGFEEGTFSLAVVGARDEAELLMLSRELVLNTNEDRELCCLSMLTASA